MGNERLRSTIAATGQTFETVATHVGVDPKTVERWVMRSRLPHRSHRWKTAELLGRDEAYLWPEVLDDIRTQAASDAEIVHLYTTRSMVPAGLWRSLLEDARDSIDLLAYAGLFLADTNADLGKELRRKGKAGVRVRILLGDPTSEAIARRGDEEEIGPGMAGRARIALKALAPALDAPGVDIRLHDTTLYNSIYRSDGTMLVNTHVYGSPAAHNPVIHLQRVAGGRVFDTYQRSFERVWNGAKQKAH